MQNESEIARLLCAKSVHQPLEPEEPREGWIYFVRAGRTAMIKVGFATDLQKRMKQLQTGCPFGLRLLAVCLGTFRRNVASI